MRSSIQLLEEVMHRKLIHHRRAGKTAIASVPIDELIAEIDSGIVSRERMLACFKPRLLSNPSPRRRPNFPCEFFD